MNHLRAIILSCLLSCIAIPILAQQEEYDKQQQENAALKAEIQKLHEDSASYTKTIQAKRNRIKELLKLTDSMIKRHSQLRSLTEESAFQTLSKEIEALEKKAGEQNAKIKDTNKEIESKLTSLENNSKAIAQLNAFTKSYGEKEKENRLRENEAYLDLRFSEMSEDKLLAIKNSLSEFDKIEGFAAFKKKLESTYNLWTIYNRGISVISSEYGSKNIIDVRSKLYPIIAGKQKKVSGLLDNQFNELDSLDIRLARYESGLIRLQGIVNEINASNEVKRYSESPNAETRKAYVGKISSYLHPAPGTELDKVDKRYFNIIPYLKKLRNKYFEELESKNITFPTKTEQKIMKVKLNR